MKMLWLSIPNFVIGNTPLPTGLLRQLRLQCRRCHLPKIRISEDSEFIQGCESAGILIGRLSRFMCFFCWPGCKAWQFGSKKSNLMSEDLESKVLKSGEAQGSSVAKI
jgi:hypothetical protein